MYLYCLQNRISCWFVKQVTHHKLKNRKRSWFIDILCPSIWQLLISDCWHLSTYTSLNYIKSYISRPLYETYIIFFLSKLSIQRYYFLFFQTFFLVQSYVAPCCTDTLLRYTQRPTFEDQYVTKNKDSTVKDDKFGQQKEYWQILTNWEKTVVHCTWPRWTCE